MRLKPTRAASTARRAAWETGRISPLRPTSPAKHTSAGMGMSKVEESTATITARSQAGSVMRRPPAIFRNTSFWPSLKPARRSSTARSIFRRRTSKPVALRCAVPYTADETSACTSKRKGRLPSSMADMAVPLSPASCMGMSISEGLATSRRPLPVISKTASSEVEPKRFLMLRSTR